MRRCFYFTLCSLRKRHFTWLSEGTERPLFIQLAGWGDRNTLTVPTEVFFFSILAQLALWWLHYAKTTEPQRDIISTVFCLLDFFGGDLHVLPAFCSANQMFQEILVKFIYGNILTFWFDINLSEKKRSDSAFLCQSYPHQRYSPNPDKDQQIYLWLPEHCWCLWSGQLQGG